MREHGLADTRLVRSARLVVVGLVLHDVPEERAMAVPAIAARNPQFLIGAAIPSALAEPAGAVIGLLAVS
ncbi:MAG: hypothetical protein AB7F22_27090 [Reyranella sp.]|uniref:hypothetical protein n=1 Tax=Reyranella sp. TaxID=1929291 RepID=UPI003D0FD6D5